MLIFELGGQDRGEKLIPDESIDDIASAFLRVEKPILPKVAELEVVRHYTNLSRKNFFNRHAFLSPGFLYYEI